MNDLTTPPRLVTPLRPIQAQEAKGLGPIAKTLLFVVAVCLVTAACVVSLAAQADLGFTAFNNTGTNGTYFINTANYKSANITVLAASGSPNGTVTVYTVPGGVDDVAKRVQVEQYATPTTAKAYIGPTQGGLVITLTGNSTGTVSVTGSLK